MGLKFLFRIDSWKLRSYLHLPYCLLYSPKGSYYKSTIIVGIFKMMLSPQAPPPAYIAVFFQGLMGELLFWKKRFFSIKRCTDKQ
jgi:hypothetical protein